MGDVKTSPSLQHTILVLLFGDLGDTLLTVPALRALRRRFPDSSVVVMAKPLPGKYVCDLGLADEMVDIDKHALDSVRSILNPVTSVRLFRLAWDLRRLQIDQLFLFQHLSTRWGALKFGMLAALTAAPVRAGLDNGRGWFLTHRIRDRGFGAVHESAYWLEVVELLGAYGEAALEAAASEHDVQMANVLLQRRRLERRQILAIHPGVGWYGPGRQWGADRFAETALLIKQSCAVECVVVGTEADRAAADVVVSHLGDGVIDLVGKTDTRELAAVLQRCDLLLSNDGGVAHLAAAVQTPTLTVFGPSNDAAWRPIGGEIIAADLPCRPCFYRDFEIGLRDGCATRECLTLVTPAAVAARALALLEATPVGV